MTDRRTRYSVRYRRVFLLELDSDGTPSAREASASPVSPINANVIDAALIRSDALPTCWDLLEIC